MLVQTTNDTISRLSHELEIERQRRSRNKIKTARFVPLLSPSNKQQNNKITFITNKKRDDSTTTTTTKDNS
jgi:hypothetical protein